MRFESTFDDFDDEIDTVPVIGPLFSLDNMIVLDRAFDRESPNDARGSWEESEYIRPVGIDQAARSIVMACIIYDGSLPADFATTVGISEGELPTLNETLDRIDDAMEELGAALVTPEHAWNVGNTSASSDLSNVDPNENFRL